MKQGYNTSTSSNNSFRKHLSWISRWLCSLIVICGFWVSGANAQVSAYTFAQSTNTYTSVTTSVLQATGWDDAVGTATIPFIFTFNGVGYTTIGYSTNGFLTFGATASSSTNYTPISTNTAYAGAAVGFARDLVSTGAAGSTITAGVTGTTPNRVVVVQWNNAQRYSGGAVAGDVVNFQIRLYETSNKVELMYGTCSATSSTNGITVEVGLRGASNSDFNNRKGGNNTAWASLAAGTTNADDVNYKNGVTPASGLTFTWTPAVVTIPACNSLLTPANGATGITTEPGSPLTWSAASGATSYDVYFGTTNTPPLLGNVTTTSTTITGTLSGTTYFWYTAPRNSAGAASGCISNIRSFTTTTGPVNDECAGATTLVMNAAAIAGTTVNADQSLAPAACNGTAAQAYDVWYKFTAINTAQNITVVGSATFDAIIQAYSGNCGALVSIGCADATFAGGTETLALTGLTICNTYYFRVSNYDAATATFTVKVAGTSTLTALTSAAATPNPVCNDGVAGNISLTATGGAGGTITWYAGGCGTGGAIGTGSPLVLPKPTTTTTYFARRETTCGNDVTACVSTIVTVNQKSADPTSASASPTTICNGGSSVLTLTGGGGGTGEVIKWYSGSCGGTLVGSSNGLSVSPTVTTTYFGRYEDAAPCSYNSLCASVTVTVNQKSANPTSATATPATICNGQATSLALNGGGGGTGEVIKWYTGSCGGTLVGAGNNLSVSPTTTTTYFGRYEDGAPCNYNSLCSSVTVIVNQKSANPTSATANPATICNGQSASLALNGGGGGTGEVITWYTASCGGTLVGTGNNLSVSPTTTTTYFGRYEDGTPCSYNSLCSSVTVTVNQKSANPTSATATPATICNGQVTSLTLNGGGGGTGEVIKWYTASCGGALVGSGNNLSVSPTTTTTYFGRYEDGAPCNYNSLCSSVTVTVNQKSANPTSATATPATICNGQATSLTLNGGGGGTGEAITWYTASCGGTLVGTGNNLSVSPTTTTTYFGRYEDGAPCNYNSLCSSVTVTVNQKSADPTSATATPATICNGDATSLTLNGGGGGIGEVIHWYSGSCGGTSVGTGNNLSVSPATTTTYYGRYEDGAPCNYNSLCSSVTVTVNPNYTITASAGANGSISPNGVTTLSCLGTGSQTYTITAATCFSIADVLVDGVSVGAVGTYTFTNVTANHTISATFIQNTYTITATSGANGSVTPGGASTVNCGNNATYTITPNTCYSIADVLVDGVSVGAVGTYTFNNVTANHTISATFTLNTYTITATSGANGSVTPAGATTVNCGDNATYTITPNACYSIADVLVDGVSVGAVGTYTFTGVTSNHTISATFTLNTYTITATSAANGSVTPAGATSVNCGDNATYTITPAACYSIADVLVDGVSVGAVGTYTFTGVTSNHTISATFSINGPYTITATSGANGTVTPAGAATVNCGDNAAYTITPNACYSIADVLVDGVSVGAVGTYTFTNVTANHTISATFTLTAYTITATSGANGSVTPSGASTVNCADNITYTITADAGYAIADVLVDGVSVGAVGTYTFTNVTANHTISASFVANNFTITSSAGANGSISPNGATSVAAGADQTYTITPNACYSIADVLVDGVSVGAVGTYTFNNVTANHTISATFVLNTYTITATSGANGSVTPAGASTVNCGDNATYTITPNACYSIADVLVDGVSVGAVGTYTFNNVIANHTISATFTLNTYTITATSGANGSVTPAGASTVNCGDNATYIITPNACYSIADVLVDGVSVGAVGTYTFTNVTTSHTISATFSLNTFTITATSGANGSVTPTGASTVNCGDDATYTITANACYSIADVLVDGVSVGAVGTYTFTNVTASHTISATFSLNTYTITATSGANGSVTPAGATTVNCGDNATYTITPAACYSIADVLVDGVSVGAVGTYTFTNVTASHTISATFNLNTYTITATSGANGTVTPAGATTVNCGDNATYTITPAACYSIADVLVDGVSVGAVGTYTFTNVTTSHTISATFSLNTFTITATSGANGTVTPAGASTVNCGDDATYTITANACYSIADVLVDGVSVGAVGTYTFTNVTGNHTISATFSLNTYTITATSGANGTVTPAGVSTVNCGDDATYTITANACYSIADVLVDGVSVGAVGTYTFTNVTASHTISATFSLNTFTITATSGANGSVTPAGASTVNCGDDATYTITANACYSIADVLVDGVSVGAVGTYTFTNVTASHTISATFSLNTFTITATSGANGSVTPAGASTVNCGDDATYTITANACYSIADVLVDGVSVGAVGTYTFTNVTASHTISATFSLNTFTITATSGANGSVTPAGASTVNCGDDATYTITANACYSIADVLVDGVSIGAVGTYTFTNVTASHTISATFTLNTYTITATSGANGSVTPAGASTVNCGDDATYTITANACYSIADVLVDGVSVGAVGTYTFTNVTASHTISATFSLNTFTITATSGANGSVTPAGPSTVNCGDDATYTITANACYSIADVLVDGVSIGAVGTYTFTNVTASHTISATFTLNTYTITATSGANGSVTPAGASTVNCGDNATYTITPNACYSIADVLVDGVSVGAVGTYTFTNVTASHTISATFSLNTYTITATSGANGSVTPAGASTVNCGDDATYTITANACYSIADVLVDGVSVGAVGTYTFTNVTTSHTISATFSLNTFTITATSGANGSVTPAGASTVNCGDDATYTITANACYSIADVLVDGVSVGAVGTYTFTNVTASHTISATFSLNTYTITATSGANGSVTPAGATTVNCGDNATYTITPNACYSIADVLVDGVSVGAVGTYTFTNVTASHTISATFTLNTYTITATSGANGSVTPAGASTVNCGDNATYTITPNACYSIADVLVDGVSVGAVGTYTFTNVTASHTISATFSLNTYTITATSGANGSVTPAGASTVNCGDDATYTITANACYSIADVLVDGVSVGAVGTYTFTNVTTSHTISATFSLNTFTITATSGANGSVTPAGASTVNCGDNATYIITPNACYSIADVLVDGVSVGAVGTYTFTNVTTSHTISATFSLNTFTITATSGANGSVTPAGASTVNCGDDATYTITANACYSIADVLVDGVSVGAVGTYTFTNVTTSHTISATFSLNTFTITATSGANGSVTPAGASTVNCGDDATYTITANACYSIADVLVDGVSVGAVGTYTFTNVTTSHTISATFSLNTFTITATSGANGSVTPAGASTVNCGDDATYTITANACYSIADVLVDGVSVGAVGTYTFTNVTASHTISATFSLNTFTITATSGANGSVTPAGASTVNCGDNATYTITPNTCYSIADVLVDGISVGAVGTYTFTNVTASHTISATFSLNTYTITATSGANGSVTPAGASTVNCGDDATYTITANACYSIADVLVDGVSVGAVGTYTFTNVTTSHTISATFSLNTFTITATSGANGSVTPAGASTVNCGDDATYTITANACYSIADVLVDGVSVGAVGTYTFTNVTTSHTISATFSLNTFTITATSGSNGSVTPAGASTVNCGDNATYTVTANACYSIADVLVDGVSVGAVGTYTFTNVTTSHTISATFSLNTYTITATSGANGSVTPAGATTVNCGDNATYTITPNACYSIADVLVDGVSVGAVSTYTFTNVTASHTISATFSLNTYTITATSGANGTVTPAGATTVNCGDNATYTITAAACYSIADVLVDGVSVGAVGTYTFTNVTTSHTISATFSLNTYTITATSGANGTVTPAGATTVNCGDNATYTITPGACYSIADVLVDGVSVGAVGTYTFTNVTASHTISATFTLNTYTITATSGANGTVTPAGASTINCGDNATYTITAAACYSIADVLVDGVSVGAVGTYTFTNVTANHTISATFSLNTYTITATSGANGSVTPAGATTVNCGDNATYTITAAACYSIADVLVDGVSVGAVGTYAFINVTASHTISATFTLNTFTITATSGANGSVTPAGATTVNCGDNATYAITAAACYSIANVLVDGVSVGAVGTYTFTNVTSSHTISATFTINTYTITATSGANGSVTPAGATTANCGSNATYTITAAACYSIADVLVDGVSVGAVGTYTFTNVTTSHTISATFTINTYTITATSGANGTVTPAGATTVNCGSNATYTITPAACYSIANVLVDGVSVGAVGTYTFTNVTTSHTISATFTINTYTITAISGANGTVTPAGATTVNCGSNATYTITPAACYSIANVLVDGVSVGAVGTYTFTNVTASHTISATFATATYTINASAGAGGTITPSGAATINCGGNATYAISANACFTIANVVVDGISQGAITTYTFTNVTANHTISATFTQTTYIITVTSGANGSVSPGTGAVNCGSNATYTITPASCYHVQDVLVDGVSMGAVTTYTFTNVAATHTISASFAGNAAPTTPVVTGPVNVCVYIGTGAQVTYTASSANATGYTWVLPPANVTIVSGQGTANLTVTFQTGFAAQPNKQLKVTATSACGNSSQVIYYLVAQGPSTPQPITGNSLVCPIIGTANTYSYTINAVAGATSYNWSAQAGTTTITHPNGMNNPNDTTVNVSFSNGFSTSTISVSSQNGCGVSGLRTFTINRVNPSQPSPITGSTDACPYMAPGGTPATYSIPAVANAVSYNWTIPAGAIGLTGQGTTSISFTYPSNFSSGTISVTATNGCGTSAARTLSVNKLNPAAPSEIDIIQTGSCPNRTYSYTIATMPSHATSVQWTIPAGATIVSGQGTTSITVSYPATAVNGMVTVQAFNNCGSSSLKSTIIKLPACAGGREMYVQSKGGITIDGMEVKVFPNPSVSDFKVEVLTAGKEQINVRILDLQGREYKHFVVQPYQATTIGSDLKAGAYMMEVRQGKEVKTSKLIKF